MRRGLGLGRIRGAGAGLLTGGGQAYDYYVDSVNGNDDNSGKNQGAAFATIGALTGKITTGKKIGLARGSSWKESLTIAANNVSVKAYGTGDRPLLECADPIPNAGFAKTVGQTNVYEVALSPDLVASGTWNRVWVDGTRLTRATSLANCDATANSYYPSSDTVAPMTMYVNSGGDPTTDGKLYEYAKRTSGIYSLGVTGVTIEGIQTTRNLSVNGSMRIGQSSTLRDVICSDGSKHNCRISSGCNVYNSSFYDSYTTDTDVQLLILNDDVALALDTIVDGCSFANNNPGAAGTGNLAAWGGHYNTSGGFGSITLQNCTFTGFRTAGGIIGQSNCVNFYINNCSFVNCRTGLAQIGASGEYTVTGGTWTSNVANQRAVSVIAGMTVPLTITGMTFNITNTTDAGYVTLTQAEEISITNCIFNVTGVGGGGIYCNNAGGVLTLTGNDWNATNNWVYLYTIVAGATWTSNTNNFGAAARFKMTIAGTSYTTLATYQTAVAPQDANSVVE